MTRPGWNSSRVEPLAFIRPSPSGGTLGGVARRTREAMLVCEAAACDVVIVETVGVGQSEVAVAGMVDVFVLLIAPGGGDELQGVKRGIVELADLLVVNKADGDLAAAAQRTAVDYAAALHIGRAAEADGPQVLTASALTGTGISEVWDAIVAHERAGQGSGALARRRAEQARAWMWSEVSDTLTERFRTDPAVRARLDDLERDVVAGKVSPSAAAQQLLGGLRPRLSSPQLAATLLASARLAPGVDRLGRLVLAQDRTGLGHALAADVAGPLVEDPLAARRAARKQSQLGAGFGAPARFGARRFGLVGIVISLTIGVSRSGVTTTPASDLLHLWKTAPDSRLLIRREDR